MTNDILITRDSAYALLTEFTHSDSLIKHGLAVEAAMRAYARHFNEDEERWGITGLIHDFDWEIHPTIPDHPVKGTQMLRERGYPEDVLNAILGHAQEFTHVPRVTLMERALFAVDELAGFITAVTLVRPSKNIADVEVASIKKKMKDKAFARAVRREDFSTGAHELGVDLDEHIRIVLDAMQAHAERLGLHGQ